MDLKKSSRIEGLKNLRFREIWVCKKVGLGTKIREVLGI